MPEATNRDCGIERGRKHLEEEEKQAHSLWEGWQGSLEDLLSFFKDNIIWLSFNYLPIFSPESSWYYPSQSNSMLCFVLDRILAILFFIMNNFVYRGILMGDYWERKGTLLWDVITGFLPFSFPSHSYLPFHFSSYFLSLLLSYSPLSFPSSPFHSF